LGLAGRLGRRVRRHAKRDRDHHGDATPGESIETHFPFTARTGRLRWLVPWRAQEEAKTPGDPGVRVVRLLVRAGDGARTRDIQLGELTLYQLSYSRRSCCCNILALALDVKSDAVVSGIVSNRRSATSRVTEVSACCSTRYSMTSERCRTVPRCE